MTVFAAIATFERKIMLQRQAEGIAVAKAKGVYKGRQKEKARRLGRACQKVPDPRNPLRIRAHAHLPCFTAYRVHVAERKRRGLP